MLSQQSGPGHAPGTLQPYSLHIPLRCPANLGWLPAVKANTADGSIHQQRETFNVLSIIIRTLFSTMHAHFRMLLMLTQMSLSIVPPTTVMTLNLLFLLPLKQDLDVLISTLWEGKVCHGRAGGPILSSSAAEASRTPEHASVLLPLL